MSDAKSNDINTSTKQIYDANHSVLSVTIQMGNQTC
jgi:hypothetical protein